MTKNQPGNSGRCCFSVQGPLRIWILIVANVFFICCISVKDAISTPLTGIKYSETIKEVSLGPEFASASGNYLAGRSAHRRRDYSNAAKYLSGALSIDSKNRQIRRQAFLSLLAGGHMPEAAVLAKEIVNLDKGDPLPTLSLLVEDMASGNYILAEKRLKALPKKGMAKFFSPLLLGWLKFAQGDLIGAIENIEELEKISSFSSLQNMHMGLIYEQAGKPDLAEKSLKKSVEKHSSVRGVMAFGVFLERKKRWKEAKEIYRRFLSGNGNDAIESMIERVEARYPSPIFIKNAQEGMAEVFFNLASTLAHGQSSDLALIYGRLALRIRPAFPLAQLLLGDLLESLSRNLEAVALYKKIDRKSPISWAARLRQASTLNELGLTNDAISLLRTMAKEHKHRFEPLIRIGDVYRSQKNFLKAIKAYDHAINRVGRLEKNHWSILYARGIAFERAKRWQNAEKDFLKALDLNPQQPFVLNYLGYSWVDRGINLERAKKMIRTAVNLRPNDGYIVDSLGWVLFRLGDFLGATKNLERAVVLRPEDPTINDHLGDAYWKVGRKNEARFQWKRALSLSPEKEFIPGIEDKLRHGLITTKTLGQ
ncbi:MAG: tetratricopeptide repeat protein [Pseudomonadota bacterium]|nr:tetratricopeptide repeat protein [Pseudomonadota bacterium]